MTAGDALALLWQTVFWIALIWGLHWWLRRK